MFKSEIIIENSSIGLGHPPYVIAEAGVNHNGQLSIAKELIREAKAAGANAVKFQTFQAERLATFYAETAHYQVLSTGKSNQKDLLKDLQLRKSDYQELKDLSHSIGITFLSTPFSREDADLLHSIGVPAYKISSGDLITLPLLEYISEFAKPIILSTGMGNMKEIEEAIAMLHNKNSELVLLQCTSSYPCELQYMNLNVIQGLRQFGCLTGLSDHSRGIACSIIASFLGASIIEKHLTLDRNMQGPDHSASLEPRDFSRLVQGVKEAHLLNSNNREDMIRVLEEYEPHNVDNIDLILGSSKKAPTPPEGEIILKARKSVVPIKRLKKGFKIPQDIQSVLGIIFELKRPGHGLAPKYLYDILGKTVMRDLNVDDQMTLADFN